MSVHLCVSVGQRVCLYVCKSAVLDHPVLLTLRWPTCGQCVLCVWYVCMYVCFYVCLCVYVILHFLDQFCVFKVEFAGAGHSSLSARLTFKS